MRADTPRWLQLPVRLQMMTIIRATDLRFWHRARESPPVFHPEFGRFMLEATPGKPWGIEFKELLEVEPNMKLRYAGSPFSRCFRANTT